MGHLCDFFMERSTVCVAMYGWGVSMRTLTKLEGRLLEHVTPTTGLTVTDLRGLLRPRRYSQEQIQDALVQLRRERVVCFRPRADGQVEWHLVEDKSAP